MLLNIRPDAGIRCQVFAVPWTRPTGSTLREACTIGSHISKAPLNGDAWRSDKDADPVKTVPFLRALPFGFRRYSNKDPLSLNVCTSEIHFCLRSSR